LTALLLVTLLSLAALLLAELEGAATGTLELLETGGAIGVDELLLLLSETLLLLLSETLLLLLSETLLLPLLPLLVALLADAPPVETSCLEEETAGGGTLLELLLLLGTEETAGGTTLLELLLGTTLLDSEDEREEEATRAELELGVLVSTTLPCVSTREEEEALDKAVTRLVNTGEKEEEEEAAEEEAAEEESASEEDEDS